MIKRLLLENWKAYRKLDLPLDDGTTFVIARNGIGKTSLMEGAMWALFGELTDVDPALCLRSGSRTATATVDLRLDEQDVRITRTYSADTETTEAAITVGDEATAGSEVVEQHLKEAFGAEPTILARMSFLREGEAVRAGTSATSDLRSHLESVFGVDTLVRLANEEAHRRRRLTKEAQATRRTQRLADSARAQLKEKAGQLDAGLVALRDEHRMARSALEEAQESVARIAVWNEFDAAIERRAEELRRLLERLAQWLKSDSLTEETAVSRLTSERGERQTILETLNRERGTVEAELGIIQGLVSTLESDTDVCPVCLRPISADERHQAEILHADRIGDLKRRSEEIAEEVEARRAQLADLEAWVEQLNRALSLPVAPTTERPGSSTNEGLARAREAQVAATRSLETVAARLAQVDKSRRDLEEELERDAEAAALSEQLFRRYREEGVSELVSVTLARTADEIVRRRIDPLATEIQNRWKLLWPDRAPLRLLSNGSLVATRGEQEVPYGEFSGGEKVVSTIIVRLLALSMTTTTPFLWLDEPLEHLDPRNRRMVASLLVKAASAERARQIVATTYEESVARRLDEADAAHLLYVESEPDV